MTSSLAFYEVGGCVRDRLLGVQSTDIDYTVEADSFDHMRQSLLDLGMEIFIDKPQYLTIRARFPRDTRPLAGLLPDSDDMGRLTADFVLCRTDGDYTDGRRPDQVHPGSIYDDLARRDFTVNAIARRADGTLLDPHGGERDLTHRRLRAVGNARDRLAEDALRALRAVRFAVTKGFDLDTELYEALTDPDLPATLTTIAADQRRKELHLMFGHDTPASLHLLAALGRRFLVAALGEDLWLKPTNEKP